MSFQIKWWDLLIVSYLFILVCLLNRDNTLGRGVSKRGQGRTILWAHALLGKQKIIFISNNIGCGRGHNLQIPPLPTIRQIRSLFYSAPAHLQAKAKTGRKVQCWPDQSNAILQVLSRLLGNVPNCFLWRHQGLLRHNMLYQEVYRRRGKDKHNFVFTTIKNHG